MSININSESYCRRAYLNYHCHGNTMGITDEEMGQITQAWSSKISSWQNSVSSDETEYEFDDSDYNNYKAKGENAAENATGYDGKNGGSVVHTVGDAASSIAGATMSVIGAVGGEAAKGVVKEGAKVITKEATKAVGKNAASNGSAAAFVVGCCLSAATAIGYWIKRPNKEEKEACDALLPEMAGAQSALGETQDDMANMANEIMNLSDEATEVNEEANSQIEEKKSEYDMYMQTYQTLKAKVDSGAGLTESEKQLYKSVAGYIEETVASIDEITEEAGSTVSDLYSDIENYQSGYDDAASTVAEIEGLTDYAAGFDKTARVMCYVEGGAQTLNASSGAIAGGEAAAFAASGAALFGSTVWAFVFAAMGFAATASSTASAAEQFKWAGEIGNEVDAREATQDLNTGTMEIYDEELDGFAGALEGVEDLELDIPDDVSAPEDMGTAVASADTSTTPAENKKPPKEETV